MKPVSRRREALSGIEEKELSAPMVLKRAAHVGGAPLF